MITEIEYKECLSFAKNITNKLRCSNKVDYIDVVHNLLVSENFTFVEYKGLIYSEVKRGICSSNNISLNEQIITYKLKNDGDRICKICGETYNKDYFKIGFSKRYNTTYYRNTCKFCHQKNRKKYPISIKSIEKHRQYVRDLRTNQKILFGKIQDPTRNERVKRYWLKQKEEITDKWIIKLLCRRKYKKSEITKEIIEQKRFELKTKKGTK